MNYGRFTRWQSIEGFNEKPSLSTIGEGLIRYNQSEVQLSARAEAISVIISCLGLTLIVCNFLNNLIPPLLIS